jgi:hypothetical protein
VTTAAHLLRVVVLVLSVSRKVDKQVKVRRGLFATISHPSVDLVVVNEQELI